MKFELPGAPSYGMTGVVAICGLILSGCGQKGALYLPEPGAEQEISPSTLPDTGSTVPLTLPEQMELPASEESGIPTPSSGDVDETQEDTPE